MLTRDRASSWILRSSGPCLLLLMAIVAGCDERPAGPPALERSEDSNIAALPAHQQLALHVSDALGHDRARQQVLKAMRSSPLTEHKLVLQEYLVSSDGSALRDRMAISASHAGSDISTLLDQVPSLDFYVPRTEDRKTWRGSDDVLVYSYVDDTEDDIYGYRVQDARRVKVIGDLESTFIALHPAEEKHLRIDPQPREPGDVIQEPGDGTISGSITVRVDGEILYSSDLARLDESELRDKARAGLERAGVDLRRAAALTTSAQDSQEHPSHSVECDEDTPILECPNPGGGYSGGVVLNSVAVTFCDGVSPWESNEIEFRSQAMGMDVIARVENVPCNKPSTWPGLTSKLTSVVLMPIDPFVGLEIHSNIYETDGTLNGDDFAGDFNPAVGPDLGIQPRPGDENVLATMGGFPPHIGVQYVSVAAGLGLTGRVRYSAE